MAESGMSASEQLSVLTEISSEDLQDKQFKCCQKSSKNIVCVKCGNIYHYSCATKNKMKCVKICETRIICSECAVQEESIYSEVNYMKFKIQAEYLYKLLEEKEQKYNLLLANNELLMQNNVLLQQKMEQLQYNQLNDRLSANTAKSHPIKNTKQQQTNIKSIINSRPNSNVIPPVNALLPNNTGFPQIRSEETLIGTDDKVLAEEQVNKSITLIPENGANINSNAGEKFTVVTYKKKKTAKKNFGENDTENFGVERKIWLYLYRIKRDVTAEKIANYFKNHTNFRNAAVTVKELPTNPSQNKCFMFGIDFEYKTEIYKPSTWPKHVAYRRFNFHKYNQYQQTEDF